MINTHENYFYKQFGSNKLKGPKALYAIIEEQNNGKLESGILVCRSGTSDWHELEKLIRVLGDAQDPVADPQGPVNDVKVLETPRDPNLPANHTEADTGPGGKILSLVGSGILILVVVFFSRKCGGFIGKQAAERKIAQSATHTNYSSTQSTLSKFDLVGLTMMLPGRPNQRTIPLPDSVKATLRSKDSYLYQNGRQTISISRDVFIEEFDFASRCDVVFEQLKNVDTSADRRQFSVDGVSGMIFTFNAGDGAYCALLVFSSGTTLWQVQVLDVVSRSENTKKLSETIFSSISIVP